MFHLQNLKCWVFDRLREGPRIKPQSSFWLFFGPSWWIINEFYNILQTSPVKTKSPARKLNFNIPAAAESRVPNADTCHPPKVTKHYKRRECISSLAERRYTAPPNQAGLELKSVLGYNGNGRKNMVWKYDTGTGDHWLFLHLTSGA